MAFKAEVKEFWFPSPEGQGGYILSTDHSLHDDIPLENVIALIETVKKYGTYPLIV